MKLTEVIDTTDAWDVKELINSTLQELGYQRMAIYQLTDENDADHHDSGADILLGLTLYKTSEKDSNGAVGSLLTKLSSLSTDLGKLSIVEEDFTPWDLLDGFHLSKSKGAKEVSQGIKLVRQGNAHIRDTIKHVMTVISALNTLAHWSRGGHAGDQKQAYKQSIARAALKELGIPVPDKS